MSKHSIAKIAKLIVVMLLATFILSSFYIIDNADHECDGAHCHICEQIQVCTEAIKNLSYAIAIVISSGIVYIISRIVELVFNYISRNETLIQLKVELNN